MYYMPAICCYSMILTVYAPSRRAASARRRPSPHRRLGRGDGRYYVPYTALTMELSDLPVERDIATTWRMYAPPSPLPKPPLRPALAVSAEPPLRVGRMDVAGRWRCS